MSIFLFIGRHFYFPGRTSGKVGGGELTNYYFLKDLQKWHDIYLVISVNSLPIGEFKYEGFHVHNIKDIALIPQGSIHNLAIRERLTRAAKEIALQDPPDFVMANSAMVPAVNAVAKVVHTHRVVNIGGYENFMSPVPDTLNPLIRTKQYLRRRVKDDAERNTIRESDLIRTCSHFMKKRISQEFDRSAHVIYPPVDSHELRSVEPSQDDIVGFIGSNEQKGLNILFDIARMMPRVKFLGFGNLNSRYSALLKSIPNLDFYDWLDDRVALFSSMRVLLVPSRFDEPFGRVAAEALACGIPALVSGRGGLPETVGNENLIIQSYNSTKEWVERLHWLLNDAQSWEELSKHGLSYASRFFREKQSLAFHQLLKKF